MSDSDISAGISMGEGVPSAGSAEDAPEMEARDVPAAANANFGAQISTLLKSSGIYAIAALGAPLVSLVLAPFLTRHLSPSEYGILAILNTAIGLTAGITQLGLGSAFFRTYSYEFTSPSDRRAVLTTVTILLSVFTIPVVIGLIALSSSVSGILLRDSSHGSLIIVAGGVIIVQNLTVPGYAWLRAENRPQFFVVLAMISLLVTLVANIVLVGVFQLGIAGALIATGCGYTLVMLTTIPLIVRRSGVRIRRDVARSLLTFGAPQVPSLISVWILQVSDRFLLGLFGTYAQVASYAVAYTLGSVLGTIVINPFQLAWPSAMFTIAKRDDAPQVYRAIFRWYSLLLLFAAFGLAIAGQVLLDGLFPRSYHSAAPVIPIVAESIAFFGLYIFFMIGASVRRVTWMPAAFTATAALINLGLNLVLIPRYGALGAAASTLIAYVALAVVAYVANQRIYPIPFEMRRFVVALAVGVVIYLANTFLGALVSGRWIWPISAAALVVYALCLIVLGAGAEVLRPGTVLARGRQLVGRGLSS